MGPSEEQIEFCHSVEEEFAQGKLTVQEALDKVGGWTHEEPKIVDGKFVLRYQACDYFGVLICDIDLLKTEE